MTNIPAGTPEATQLHRLQAAIILEVNRRYYAAVERCLAEIGVKNAQPLQTLPPNCLSAARTRIVRRNGSGYEVSVNYARSGMVQIVTNPISARTA